MSTEPLYTCPRCQQSGFTRRGLSAHVCRGPQTGDERRRLTAAEIRAASHSSPFTLPNSTPSPMSKTDNKNTHALAILGDRALSYDQAMLPKIQAAALQQLAEVARLVRERGARAVLEGLALCRVKASLKHGQFQAWLKPHVKVGLVSCNNYMRLALAFVEKSGVSKPDLLALPGDQTSLAIDAGDDAQRRFFAKLEKFVGQSSLSELLAKHDIKGQPKLGGARLPDGQDDESDDAPPADPETLAAQKREEISAWIAKGRALLVAENACQFLGTDDQRSVLEGIDALRTDLREALRHISQNTAPDLSTITGDQDPAEKATGTE